VSTSRAEQQAIKIRRLETPLMGDTTKIEWTDSTFNPWIGCQKVSPGCDHCYAEAMMDHRYGRVQWGPHGERQRTSTANWRKPLRWNREGEQFEREYGHRHRVFCASLADVFDNQVNPQWRIDLFKLIKQTPALDWLLLTKRPQNIRNMLPGDWDAGWPNVWLGTTCESQEYYDQRWPALEAFRPGCILSHTNRQSPPFGCTASLIGSFAAAKRELVRASWRRTGPVLCVMSARRGGSLS
jgi:Protein of unknown function (DUF5131)